MAATVVQTRVDKVVGMARWEVRGFHALPRAVDAATHSPTMEIAGRKWSFEIYPGGAKPLPHEPRYPIPHIGFGVTAIDYVGRAFCIVKILLNGRRMYTRGKSDEPDMYGQEHNGILWAEFAPRARLMSSTPETDVLTFDITMTTVDDLVHDMGIGRHASVSVPLSFVSCLSDALHSATLRFAPATFLRDSRRRSGLNLHVHSHV